MNLAAIAQQCDGAHRDQHGWRARCPVHQGKSDTSLSLWEDDSGIVRVKCWAECDYRDVLAALDLTRETLPKQPDVIYSYHQADGHLLFQVCKQHNPRRFFQRRPDPSNAGEWVTNVRGVEQIVYRLPEVKRAVLAHTPVYIVEGEKDVETLRSHGLVATCNAMGAGKWRDSHSAAVERSTKYPGRARLEPSNYRKRNWRAKTPRASENRTSDYWTPGSANWIWVASNR